MLPPGSRVDERTEGVNPGGLSQRTTAEAVSHSRDLYLSTVREPDRKCVLRFALPLPCCCSHARAEDDSIGHITLHVAY